MIRFIFRLIFLTIILVILIFIFAPNILSTSWGKSILQKVYKGITGNTLVMEKLDISWWKGQSIEQITFKDAPGKLAFTCPKITTDATLWQVLFSHDLGNVEILQPHAIISADIPVKATPPTVSQVSQASQVTKAGFIPSLSFVPIAEISLPSYFGHLSVKEGQAAFVGKGFDPIEIQEAVFDATLQKSQIKLQGSGKTLQKAISGSFDLNLACDLPQIDLSAKLQNFPMRSLDQIVSLTHPQLQGVLLGTVGEAVNVDLKLKNQKQALEVYLDAKSPIFSAHIESATQDDIVTLASPAIIDFQIPAEAFKPFYAGLQNPFQGQFRIEKLRLPLADKESAAFQATLKGQTLQFSWGEVQPFSVLLSTENFKDRHFTLKVDSPQAQVNMALYVPTDWQALTLEGEALFPQNTRINFNAQTLSTITLNIQGDVWQGSFLGGFDPVHQTLTLAKPATFLYHLSQLPAPLPPLLKEPTTLRLNIDPCKINLADQSGQIAVKLEADPATLENIPIGQTLISLHGDLKSKKGTFELTSAIDQGPVSASGTFGWPNDISARCLFSEAPIALIDLFLKSKGQLTPILGSKIDGTLNLTLSKESKTASLQLKTPTLSADATVQQKDNTLQLLKPAQLTLTLSPEGYTALDEWLNPTPTPFVLTQPATIQATVNSLRMLQNEKIPQSFKVDCSIDTLAFASKETPNSATSNSATSSSGTKLDQLKLHLEHTGGPFIFNFSTTGAALQGSLDSKTGLNQLQGKLDRFPTPALDVLARAFGPPKASLATIFGPQIDLTLNTSLDHWSGPMQLQLNSTNIRASLDGVVNQGMLALKDTLHVQIMLTEDLSHLIFNSLNPLSLSGMTSEGPITLQIPAEGFSFPLQTADPTKINIPSGRLELGKIFCHNEGNLNVALGLLKLSQFSQNQNLELWFAPLDFHVKGGLLDCERTEILISEKYQVCTWGKIDFIVKEVDMVLGLTASCLRQAFGIKNLPDNYVLQVPMRGPLNNVKINTAQATAKIAALLLWQQKGSLVQKNSKGTAGAFMGEFLNKLGPLPDIDSKAPPPKPPFPWDNKVQLDDKKTSDATPIKKKKLFQKEDKPLKQLLKVIR